MTLKLLTEPEVAEILRCSANSVKRLRLQGKLTYIPGRPILIDEADVAEFLERERQASIEKHKQRGRTKEQEARAKTVFETLQRRAALAEMADEKLKPSKRRKNAGAG